MQQLVSKRLCKKKNVGSSKYRLRFAGYSPKIQAWVEGAQNYLLWFVEIEVLGYRIKGFFSLPNTRRTLEPKCGTCTWPQARGQQLFGTANPRFDTEFNLRRHEHRLEQHTLKSPTAWVLQTSQIDLKNPKAANTRCWACFENLKATILIW